MLYFDIAAMPDEQLIQSIMDVCSDHGAVSCIRIERGPVERGAANRAIVEMSSSIEAIRLRREVGDSLRGLFVTIDLHQRGVRARTADQESVRCFVTH